MSDTTATGRSGIAGAAAGLIDIWAILGGVLLLAVVLVNVLSVIGGVVWKPFPGDFELTEMGVAIAAFAFLPYCQLHGLNVTADIFTARAGPRWIAGFGFFSSMVAFLFAVILCRQMYAGMLDQKAYNYTTAILQVPSWWAYLPILISLALLAVAGLLTLGQTGRLLWRGEQAP